MAVLPQEIVTLVSRAYARGTSLLDDLKIKRPESVEIALAAASHRWYWRPDKLKTILFADARDITSSEELACQCKVSWLKIDGESPPNSFVRLPYCLAYGEPDLVPGIAKQDNKCPLHLWDLFGDLTERGDCPYEAKLVDRLAWKVKTLTDLKARGIWVVDPTHFPGQNHPELIRIWWEGAGRGATESDQPLLVAYGKSYFDLLKQGGIPVDDWLYHPQHRKTDQAVDHDRKLFKVIHKLSTAH